MGDSALLREILDAQLEMVCRFRRDGTILFVNRAYARTLDREPVDLAGRDLWTFVSADDRLHVEEMLQRLTLAEPELTIENRFETASGTRWILWRNHALEFDGHGNWQVAQSTGIDITERKDLEDQLELLVGELNHRVKNTLMVVQAMAHQTFRGSSFPRSPIETFNQRLAALSGAHDALSRTNWTGADLAEIIRQGLLICDPDDMRVHISGPPVVMPANATVSLVMVLHELATNAIKYGALSTLSGQLLIDWDFKDGMVEIVWREVGGPEVVPPSRKGFGSRLLTEAVPRQLGGRVDLAFEKSGLLCVIAVPPERKS